jgi:hypothetical protein
MSTEATQAAPQTEAPKPKVNRAQAEQELAFWKQCYAAALTRNADSDVALMCANQGVNQLRKKLSGAAPAGDCISKAP